MLTTEIANTGCTVTMHTYLNENSWHSGNVTHNVKRKLVVEKEQHSSETDSISCANNTAS